MHSRGTRLAKKNYFTISIGNIIQDVEIQVQSLFEDTQQELLSSERDKEIFRERLIRKQAELASVQEALSRAQQQMRERVSSSHNTLMPACILYTVVIRS